MSRPYILILEDEIESAQTLAEFLTAKGFDCVVADNGNKAISIIHRDAARLSACILDVMVPEADGYQVCALLKSHPVASDVPVLFLTAKDREEDEISGIKLGAELWLSKPAGLSLIATYLDSLLKKFPRKNTGWLGAGPVWIDTISRTVLSNGKPLNCTPTEFKLLQLMLEHPNRVYDRQEILDLVYQNDTGIFDRTIDAHIKNLRLKLGDAGRFIRTVRGIGYGWDVNAAI
jgi:DNA-binding response OmpR family regulator